MPLQPPNSIPWPPLIYMAAAGLGVMFTWALPLPWVEGLGVRLLGAALFLAAAVIDVTTALAFRRHKTTILPHRSASALITSGPFAWSRNPIYLANTMMLVGAGLALRMPWLTALALPAAFLTQKLAIEREERHLAEAFGEVWHSYAAKVPRWLIRL